VNLEDVIERYANSRPGYSVVDFKQAAVPLYHVTARVITLDAKPLSPLEEGCLRAVEAGLERPEDIFSFLGLPKNVLSSTLATLNTRELVTYIRTSADTSAAVCLTERGRMVLSSATAIEPEERLVRFTFDPYLGRIVFLPVQGLFRPREIKERGWLELPLCGRRRPEVADIPLAEIDRVIRRNPTLKDEVRELLSIRRLERREMMFLQAAALYFRSNDGADVQVAIVLEDGPSLEHESAFRELGGPELVGAQLLVKGTSTAVAEGVAPKAVVEAIPEVDKLFQAIAAAESIASNAGSAVAGGSAASVNEVQVAADEARRRLQAMTQRPLRTHEHPLLLRQALSQSKERLMIISPWITHHVVDNVFLMSLSALLRNGCKVYIAYGIGADDGRPGDRAQQKPPISFEAKRDLDELDRQFKNFSFSFIGNTHRKLLVSDSKFAVVTSFNWLSFKGDPKAKPRDEFGFLITEPKSLEDVFRDGVELMESGYDHPKPSFPPKPRTGNVRGRGR
jgi:hypothetical protein